MKYFVKGDIDGLFALGLDNLLMLILMSSLCLGFPLFFPAELFYGKILPATAVGLIIGNVFYARQAMKLAQKENRTDVCAIPYGINLLTVFVYVFLVMFPAKLIALGNGASEEEACLMAWRAGLAACLGSGLIEFCGAFVVNQLRKITPRAALLSALSCIGLFFIAMDFVFRAYAHPYVGLTTLAITLAFYFGRLRFKLGIPGGLVILGLGSVVAWIQFALGQPTVVPVGVLRPEQIGLHIPLPVLGDMVASLPYLVEYLPVIVPMGFINVVLSLQNLESAKAAGDDYPARPLLAVNGVGTIVASCLGSAFPTTIYIGHPGWKAIGARAGYSTLNAIVMSVICLTGVLSYVVYVIPIEAGSAILIWIGIMMCSQAFEATPKAHYPAVAMGLLPGLAAFTALAVKNTMRALGFGGPDNPFPPDLAEKFAQVTSLAADGMFALEMGWVYSSIILSAATVCIIERQFYRAGYWFLAGAFLAMIGFTSTYVVTPADVIGSLSPSWKWVIGYGLMATVMFVMPWVTEHNDNAAH